MVDIRVAQPVLVLAVLEFAAGVDEEHVGRRLGLVEDGDGGRDARSVEEVARESDDGLDEVLLDGLLTDFPRWRRGTARRGERRRPPCRVRWPLRACGR